METNTHKNTGGGKTRGARRRRCWIISLRASFLLLMRAMSPYRRSGVCTKVITQEKRALWNMDSGSRQPLITDPLNSWSLKDVLFSPYMSQQPPDHMTLKKQGEK